MSPSLEVEAAIERFGNHRGAAFAVLQEAANDANATIRERAIAGMSRLGKAVPEAASFLWNIVHSSDKNLQDSALFSLYGLGLASKDLPALAEVLPGTRGKSVMAQMIAKTIKQDPAAAKPFVPAMACPARTGTINRPAMTMNVTVPNIFFISHLSFPEQVSFGHHSGISS